MNEFSYKKRKNEVIRALIGPHLILGLEPNLMAGLWVFIIAMLFIFKTWIFIPVGIFIQWMAVLLTKKDPEMRKVWFKFRDQGLRYDPYVRAQKIKKGFKGGEIVGTKPSGFGKGGI
jgi:type IV secretory pathway TrbD component